VRFRPAGQGRPCVRGGDPPGKAGWNSDPWSSSIRVILSGINLFGSAGNRPQPVRLGHEHEAVEAGVVIAFSK
jgi:hypothetical protein